MRSNGLGQRGFTLLEIIVALAVIAILSAAVTPAIIGYVERARTESVVEDVKAIQLSMSQYYSDVGDFTPLRDIRNFTAASDGPAFRHFIAGDQQPGWDGPYMSEIKVGSDAGGTFDIDVTSPDQAVITLGNRAAIGGDFNEVLRALNAALDGDNSTRRGVVWGDNAGIHIGVNTFRP